MTCTIYILAPNKYKVEMIDEMVAKSILQTKNELIDLDYCIDFNTNEEITVEELIQKIKEISKYKEHKLVENKEKGVWSKLEKETIEMLIYVASISFQVAGALVLLLFSLSTKRQEVIKRFSGTGIIFRDGNTKELTYNEKEFKNTFRSGYLNKCALGYITIGYFGGVFGSIGEYNKVFVGLMIILVTIFLLIISINPELFMNI